MQFGRKREALVSKFDFSNNKNTFDERHLGITLSVPTTYLW